MALNGKEILNELHVRYVNYNRSIRTNEEFHRKKRYIHFGQFAIFEI